MSNYKKMGMQALDKHLLVVDDDLKSRKIISMLLEERGYKISLAKSGAEALAILSRNNPFNLILTDINMPGMSGIELIETLQERGKSIPFCVVSSVDDKMMISRLQGLGCSGFLVKPLRSRTLVEKVETILASI